MGIVVAIGIAGLVGFISGIYIGMMLEQYIRSKPVIPPNKQKGGSHGLEKACEQCSRLGICATHILDPPKGA